MDFCSGIDWLTIFQKNISLVYFGQNVHFQDKTIAGDEKIIPMMKKHMNKETNEQIKPKQINQ